jgi:hypothetical protein
VIPPTLTVTPDPLTHTDPACIQTNGTIPKHLEVDTTLADGTHDIQHITLVEAKVTWNVPPTGEKVVFVDLDYECPGVTRVVKP